MSYKKTTIGAHCSVTSSKRFHASERTKEGVPFYCSKEIIQKVKGEDVTECDYISEDAYKSVEEKYGVPQVGDLLITTRGTYGVPYIYKDYDKFYFADGNLTWLKDFDDELDVEYLYYWINSYEGQKKIDAIAKGTAQKAVPIATLKQIEIEIPDISTQKKVVCILKAYDDLIENNKKQIKLLEEAAQRLYKEWFVDLRFLGYEDVEIVDGVPVSWKKTSIGELGEFLRGKTITKKQVVKGNIPVVAGGITPAYYHNKSNTEAPVITVSASGNAGFVNVYTTKIWASDCSYLDINMSQYFYYILCSMKDRQTEIYTLQHGSAQQHVNANQINALEILKPSDDVLKQFIGLVKPIYEKIGSLIKQSEVASEARNRLLPKLMNGEIEV